MTMTTMPPSLHPNWPQFARIVTAMFPDLSEPPTPGLFLTNLPGYDSFSRINLVLAAEEAFHIRFSAARVSSLRCLGDFLPP